MGKYPTLTAIATLARIVGWIVLTIAGTMCLVGAVKTLAALASAANNPYNTNPFDLYGGISLVVGGGSLLVVSVILIAIGEVIKVFIDIERNTSESARTLQSMRPDAARPHAEAGGGSGPRAVTAHPAAVANTPMAAAATPTVSERQNNSSDFTSWPEVAAIIELARQAGYEINRSSDMITFTRDGLITHCYQAANVRAFAVRAGLIS